MRFREYCSCSQILAKSSPEEKKIGDRNSALLRSDDLVILSSLSKLGEMRVYLAAQVGAALKAKYCNSQCYEWTEYSSFRPCTLCVMSTGLSWMLRVACNYNLRMWKSLCLMFLSWWPKLSLVFIVHQHFLVLNNHSGYKVAIAINIHQSFRTLRVDF